jgi:hypothetical protein
MVPTAPEITPDTDPISPSGIFSPEAGRRLLHTAYSA